MPLLQNCLIVKPSQQAKNPDPYLEEMHVCEVVNQL